MTAYEILLLLDPDLPEERQTDIISRARELVERDGGTWDRHDAWGQRKLAYEIDHKGDGIYHLLLFHSEAATLDEISRVLRITDGVIRHLAVRRPKGPIPPPPPPLPREEPRHEEPEATAEAEPPEPAAAAEAEQEPEPAPATEAEPETVQDAG